MYRQVYEINENGYLKNVHMVKFDDDDDDDKEGNSIEELAENIVIMPPPNGLYRAKWTGIEWIEDMSQEEIDELNNHPRIPTDTEILMDYIVDVDFRVVLLELGLI